MFIKQIVCLKNPEYRARLTRPADTKPITTPSLFNELTNTQRHPTLSSSKLKKYRKTKTSIRIILSLFFSSIIVCVCLRSFTTNSRYS